MNYFAKITRYGMRTTASGAVLFVAGMMMVIIVFIVMMLKPTLVINPEVVWSLFLILMMISIISIAIGIWLSNEGIRGIIDNKKIDSQTRFSGIAMGSCLIGTLLLFGTSFLTITYQLDNLITIVCVGSVGILFALALCVYLRSLSMLIIPSAPLQSKQMRFIAVVLVFSISMLSISAILRLLMTTPRLISSDALLDVMNYAIMIMQVLCMPITLISMIWMAVILVTSCKFINMIIDVRSV